MKEWLIGSVDNNNIIWINRFSWVSGWEQGEIILDVHFAHVLMQVDDLVHIFRVQGSSEGGDDLFMMILPPDNNNNKNNSKLLKLLVVESGPLQAHLGFLLFLARSCLPPIAEYWIELPYFSPQCEAESTLWDACFMMWCLSEEVEPSSIVNFLLQVRSGFAGSTLHLQMGSNLPVSSFFCLRARPISQIQPFPFLSFAILNWTELEVVDEVDEVEDLKLWWSWFVVIYFRKVLNFGSSYWKHVRL